MVSISPHAWCVRPRRVEAPPTSGSSTATSARVSSRSAAQGRWPACQSARRDIARGRLQPRRAGVCRLTRTGPRAGAYCHDIGAIAAFLVGDRHRPNGASKPRRLLDGCVNLGDATIEVGYGLVLDGEAGLGVGGSVRERQIDGCHMIGGGRA
jgi:hypothetical protein